MRSAKRRAIVSCPKSLDELRPRRGERPVALACSMTGCSACAAFDAEGRDDYEARLSVTHDIIPWKCDKGRRVTLAMDAGVDELPAYLLLSHDATRVVRP